MAYNVGAIVTNIGNIYSCTVAGWCGNPVWTPGTGHPSYPDAERCIRDEAVSVIRTLCQWWTFNHRKMDRKSHLTAKHF
ncbi:hypothetical protein OH492_16960 [Vibrio chagasii]|nr:hypothetical protein [Vibrio chagasii]